MFSQAALIAETDNLRKFALRLTGNRSDADDLLQSTFLRVLEKRHYFEQGTSLRKWASKIMFNLFVTEYRRKTKFETRYDPEPYLQAQSVSAVQEDRAELSAVGDAMNRLSPDHREGASRRRPHPVRLQVRSAAAGTAHAEGGLKPSSVPPKPRILVIDDEAAIRESS